MNVEIVCWRVGPTTASVIEERLVSPMVDSIPLSEKCCTKCHLVKPISFFIKNKAQCRQCRTEYNYNRRQPKTKRMLPLIQCPPGQKRCPRCVQIKSVSEFYKSRSEKDGYQSKCKECQSEYNRNIRKLLPSRGIRHREYTYGLSDADYNMMLFQQGGGCAICGQPQTRKMKNLCVDHAHDETGRVRGLLCHECNLLVGNIERDTILVKKAVKYLSRFEHGAKG